MKRSSEERKLDLIELVLATVALVAIVGAIMATVSGCIIQGDEEEWRELIAPHLAALSNKLDQASAALESPAAQGEAEESKAPPTETDAISFESMQWCYGGFNGAKAAPVDGCEIADLKISSSGMTYQWKGGGCEQLGASSRSAADCIAALFVKGADGEWRGGKFEWIGTSRTTRSFSNIEGEYHGWPSDSIKTARGYAFCIVSKDGKKRSNVIAAEDR